MGALSMGVACAVLALRPGPSTCRHVYRPVMESAGEDNMLRIQVQTSGIWIRVVAVMLINMSGHPGDFLLC